MEKGKGNEEQMAKSSTVTKQLYENLLFAFARNFSVIPVIN